VLAEHVASSGKRCARRPRNPASRVPRECEGPPNGILGYHVEDQLANFFAHGLSADRLPTRETNPQCNRKTARCQRTTVSGDTRMSAVFREGQRQELVSYGKPGAGVLTFEHGQLLSQGEIFNQQNPARAKQTNEDPATTGRTCIKSIAECAVEEILQVVDFRAARYLSNDRASIRSKWFHSRVLLAPACPSGLSSYLAFLLRE
jgi:hypothetical protein